ncbi:fibronectin-binding protein A, amine-terminal protein (macronuclear) [Tetrahymena thermophila SB210]|uniref:Fibronectin-binding protein A, amine-terminal protein n=1 Tax=Tetrahymena thermophila (strain SB210) TaxID=312017 RepID=Q22TC3_TETTS|nr:fibronectin-binding protein A, amine-terminal protein [Tetrahymena thermophila SB210]EAR88515.1 fibronectin-binding protein A, amine-terminal protein [Tetrahymena thermophila SB210]|eukprot:XP_001008760.1 fibronectin-binding protein A, amine-terminal protein [Tetrahymena thermophila SB210]
MSGEKTKVRLTSLDITALVTELKQKLIGLRVSNIYDINQKTYLFKLARGETKEFLLIENGIRFHTTDIQQEKSKMPSGFTMKFRKYLRSKRLEDIKQIGVERVIILTFGSGESTNHIILEMYSSGNIILTDKDFNIILLMRQHQFTETIKTAIGERYPFEQAANLYLEKFDTSESIIEELIKQKENQEENNEQEEKNEDKKQKNNDKEEEEKDEDEADKKKKNKQKKETKDGKNNQKDQDKQKKDGKKNNAAKATKGYKLREIVFKIVPSLHNPVIDHIISSNGLNPNQKVTVADVAIIKQMADKCKDLILDFQKTVHQGYLIVSDKKEVKHRPNKQEQQQIEGAQNNDEIPTEKAKEEKKEEEKEKYFDFSPLYLTCHEGKKFIENNSFNASVDKYFQVMAQKIQEEQNDVESIAWKKYENIKNDQLNRIQKLKNEQEEYVVKAQLIEMNIDYVDAIINIIKTLKSSGESWDKITKMINEGKKNGDPMAYLIHSLDFENNEISVLLGDPCDDMEEYTVVAIDIAYSAHQNARNYYENKKKNIVKEKKTLDASKLALKQAEKTALKEIENLKLKNNVVNTRKQYWFEKFYWFISSENYLVISGRDMQQNEIIVKKYMRKGDIYMHADFHGAASTIIKNPFKDIPVSQQTIEEAAIATICRSKAWEAKIIASAWWVYDHQVSKRAETGEYLPSGSFMIRGKKNFIYPARMEMGCTLLYKLDDQFVEKHLNDRRRKDKDDNTTTVSGVQIDNQNDFDETNFEIRPNMQLESQQSDQGVSIVNEDPFAQQQQQNKIEQVPILLQKASTSVIDEEVTMIRLNVPPQPKPKNAQQIQKEIQQAKQKNKQQQKDDKSQSKNGNDGKKSKDQKDAKKKDNKKNDSSSESDKEDEKQNNNKPVPRGKKNKIKKMQEKYADQDEEERQLRMHLIGAKQMKDVKIKEDQAFSKKNNTKDKDNKGKNNKDKDSKNQKQQQIEDEEELEIPCGVPKKADDQISKGSIEVEACEDLSLNQIPSKITEQLSAVDLNKDQAEEPSQEKPAEEESVKDAKPSQEKENEDELSNPEDGDNEEDDELAEQKANEQNKIDEDVKDEIIDSELQELSRLATFTYPEETYSSTLLMCAPYNTISILNSKYKIKLVPGTLKKGKAAKSIVHFFQSSKDTNQQEKKCLKNMTEQEIINCIIGNVKLAGAGLQKIKDKEKQAKKQARKTKDAAQEKK